MSETFEQSKSQQWIWKSPQMQSYAVAFVGAGMSLLNKATLVFASDDVPESSTPISSGIAGAVISSLSHAGIIEPVGVTMEGVWYPLRRASIRQSRHHAYVNVYRLSSRSVAEEFLRRHGVAAGHIQKELFAA